MTKVKYKRSEREESTRISIHKASMDVFISAVDV